MPRFLLAGLVVALAAACSSDPRTQVIVRIEADPGVASRIASLHVRVENLQDPESPVELERTVAVGDGAGEVELPAHVPVYPRFEDATRRFRAVAEALDPDDDPFARVEGESGYVAGETRVLVLRFEDDCIDVTCTEGQTCRDGDCTSSRVDPGTLPSWPYDSGMPPPRDSGMDASDASDAGDAGDARDAGDAGDAGDGGECDRDGDMHRAMGVCGGDDCDDAAASVHPGATETCNGDDDDCDGAIDDGAMQPFYRDADGDGYGVTAMMMTACTAPTGYVMLDGDCNDGDRLVNPDATEECNGTDDDCDGSSDPGCACTDGMSIECGTGMLGPSSTCVRGTQACVGGVLGACTGNVEPVAEVCDAMTMRDEDCDGVVNDGVTVTCFADADGDGHGATAGEASEMCPVVAGGCPAGFALANDDCDDAASAIHTGAAEVCNGLDDDCDGLVPVPERDMDGDGVRACDPTPDCDDSNPAINPTATETCNAIDDDCDGDLDDGIGCGTPPTVVRPFDGFRTGSALAPAARGTLRPTFVWRAGTLSPTGSVVHEIQLATGCSAGRGCSFATVAAGATAVSGTTWTPTTDLVARTTAPVGTRYAWRVRACSTTSATRCTDWSIPHYVDVGRAYRDINGDGRSDIVVSADAPTLTESANGRVVLLPSSGAGVPGSPTTLLHPTSATGTLFGYGVALADIDADGYDDVIAGAPLQGGGEGGVHLFTHSAATGLPTTPRSSVSRGGPADEELGTVVASAGDLDGDGFEDVAASAPTGPGVVVVFRGSTSGIALASSQTITVVTASLLGDSIGGGGDETADGRADLALGAPASGTGGAVFVFDGADTFFTGGVLSPTRAHMPPMPITGAAYGSSVAFVGRVDDDDACDLAIGAPGVSSSTGRVFVVSSTRTIGSFNGFSAADRMGSSVASLGDIDGDGNADLAACGSAAPVGDRCYYVLGTGGISLGTARTIETDAPDPDTQLGAGLAGPFDLNADGFDDVVLTEPAWRPAVADGRGVIHYGAAGFSPTSPSTFGEGYVEPMGEQFGHSLASVLPRPALRRNGVWHARVSPLFALLSSLFASSRSHAQPQTPPRSARDRTAARAAFGDGVRALEAGQLDAAAAHFDRSLALFPNPPAAFNLASCLRQLGRLRRATEVLAALLAGTYGELAPDRRAEAVTLRDGITAEMPTLTIALDPAVAHASVTLDGQPADPRPVSLDPGEHTVRAEAPGHVTITRRVTLVARATERVVLHLVPIAQPPRATPPPIRRDRRPPPADDGDGETPLVERPLFWVGVGAAVVAATVGVVLVATVSGGVEDPIRDPVFGATATLRLP